MTLPFRVGGRSVMLVNLARTGGYCCPAAAVVEHGGLSAAARRLHVSQSARPVKDLVTPGRFLLIAGEDGQAWCEAACQLAAETGLPLDALRIGHLDGDLYDPRCTWLRHRQIASDGAILVRPDRFIAWWHQTGTNDPRAVLAAALSQILARPAGVDGPQV